MNWDKVLDVVSHNTQWAYLNDHMTFLLDFFTCLFKALQSCVSVDECASLYPRAGHVLTSVATHPALGCHPSLTTLVIECLLEYTKYKFTTDPLCRSSEWCIKRLRRIHQVKSKQHQVATITKLLLDKLQSGTLTISKMHQLGDLALTMINDNDQTTMIQVFETLFDVATKLDHPSSVYFSSRFIQHLSLNERWPITLKIKCWQAIPILFEFEWMTFIEQGGDGDGLMQGLTHCPGLMHTSFVLIANWMTDWPDWKILRLWLTVWTRQGSPSFLALDTASSSVDQVYAGLMSFIYAGSPLDMMERRNQAWLISMMYPVYISQCTDDWIGWCKQQEEEDWTEKMDYLSCYIAWLVCPSLDNRMVVYHHSMNDWIQSFKGFGQTDPLSCPRLIGFLDQWYILVNGHLPVGASLLGSMIHHSREWTSSQCLSVINQFIDHANLHEVSKSSVTRALVERLTMMDDLRMNDLIPQLHI
ncbi:hypothetical protein BC941DRAFT_437810 [Chlamydoabsidia padenii]|nr:hypothetical protein BC941DRAFT_437810 [Chlamydoabsidia padenii]